MIFFLLITLLIGASSGAQTSEEICDPNDLALCVDAALRVQVVLPRTEEELEKYCLIWLAGQDPTIAMSTSDYHRESLFHYRAYQSGMSCMDTWIKRCLAADKQQLVQERVGGVRALMQYLCGNDTALRRDFLNEQSCWSLVSPDWSSCVDDLQLATRHVNKHFPRFINLDKNTELCCSRDAFVSCVGHAGRVCSSAAGTLLRHMAWELAQDISPCRSGDEKPSVTCAAPPHPRFSALLSVLYYVYYYI